MRPTQFGVRTSLLLSLATTLVLSGCAGTLPRRDLEGVAKDWSRMIRASQIIPVYPLTEDLRPGDIFLVETPVQEQAREYEKSGFLRLEQALGRLGSLPYDSYYGESYGVSAGKWPPDQWGQPQKPAGGDAGMDLWTQAPRAAFPTYSFAVHKGHGANLAIPLQGVPFGLSLMHTASATGTVTIADAFTYGLPLDRLQAALETWYDTASNRAMVSGIRDQADTTVYLRVIARVYLTKNLVVSMHNTSTAAASASAGKSQEVRLLEGRDSSAANYTKALDVLNESLDRSAIGGGLKILQASERFVNLSERFVRPLVVGYISFDFPIDQEGALGAARATVASVSAPRAKAAVTLGSPAPADRQLKMWRWYVAQEPGPRRARTYLFAAQALGKEFQSAFETAVVGDSAERFDQLVSRFLIGKSPFDAYQRRVATALQLGLEHARKE